LKDSDFLDRVQRRDSPPKLLHVTSGNSSTLHLREVFLKTFPEAQRLFPAKKEIVEIGGSSSLPPFQHDLPDHP
jgi:predicted nuclease of predicted toxin-antitoxin system